MVVVFFKQKTAYEMRISDWSSDVCSSDLNSLERKGDGSLALRIGFRQMDGFRADWAKALAVARANGTFDAMEALARRAELPGRALRSLADAHACRAICVNRRDALCERPRIADAVRPIIVDSQARVLSPAVGAQLHALSLARVCVY